HFEHDRAKEILADIAKITMEEMQLDFESAGSTTFKREALKRGFEPDASFYIQTQYACAARNGWIWKSIRRRICLIEIDVTNDSLDKCPVYAALRVPEIWRYEDRVEIWILEGRHYIRKPASTAIPVLNEKLISELMESSLTMDRPAWTRQTRNRICELIS